MSIGIINIFELIRVNDQKGENIFIPKKPVHLLFNFLVIGPAVFGTGQLVLMEFFLQFFGVFCGRVQLLLELGKPRGKGFFIFFSQPADSLVHFLLFLQCLFNGRKPHRNLCP